MSLLVQAELDLAVSIEGPDFGTLIVIRDPTDVFGTGTTKAQVGDVGQAIDPDTGLAVTGRLIHVAVRQAALVAAGFTALPVGIADPLVKPWRLQFKPTGGVLQWFKVKESRPDRTLGIVFMLVEFWVET